MPTPNILIIGDVMLDVYIDGEVKRRSPEADVPVLSSTSAGTLRAGGAGNVAANVHSLGGRDIVITVMGYDSGSKDMPMSSDWLVTLDERPTTQKIRISDKGRPIARIDVESEEPIDDQTTDAVLKRFYWASSEAASCVISDYGKGVVTDRVAQGVVQYCRSRNIPVLVDPIGKCWKKYAGATVIKANAQEAMLACGIAPRSAAPIHSLGQQLVEEYKTNVVITLGDRGLHLYPVEGGEYRFPNRVPVEKADVVGAGDTVIAAMAVRMAMGEGLYEACNYAVAAANLVVQKPGTSTVTAEEVDSLLKSEATR